MITSLLATCEQNGVNGYDYLLAIQQPRRTVAKSPTDWLPWNYREVLETDSLAA